MTGRVTQRGRDRAIGRLQRGYVCGELGTQTFERRLETALACDSAAVLRQVTSDFASPTLLDRARRWLAPPRDQAPSSGLLAALSTDAPTIVGRAGSCDFVIAHHSVSRRHAMLARDGERVIVTDLGSTNGTFVNGRWITQAEVLPGDRLRLGQLELLL